MTVGLAFSGGGYLPGPTAQMALLALVGLALVAVAAARPLEGFGWGLAAAAVPLAVFTSWSVLSRQWSQAPGRALIEGDRALLYLTVLLLFGVLVRGADRVRWLVRATAATFVAVALIALTTRLVPGVLQIKEIEAFSRLRFPVDYWNTLGLLAALGLVLCFGLTTDAAEPRSSRVVACAAMPVLAATLVLTLSRGGVLAAALGVLLVLGLGRGRDVPAAVLASLPAAGVAAASAYGAELLSSPVSGAAAQAQGQRVAIVVAACVLAGAVLRLALTRIDVVLPALRGRARTVVAALSVLMIVAATVAGGAVLAVGIRDAEVARLPIAEQEDPRRHLLAGGSSNRTKIWRVALEQVERTPWRGSGAGTYPLTWQQHRIVSDQFVQDGHSLYAEVFSELGIVGLGLIVAALLAILIGVARQCRGPDRPLFATVLAASTVWALAAGFDWHWEMPVVSLWFFALGGACLARSAPRARRLVALRVAVPAACAAVLIAVPLRVAASENRIEAAEAAYASRQCKEVPRLAAAASAIDDARPQPYVLLAGCALQDDRVADAVGAMRQAVTRELGSAQLRYGLAVALARAGRDPGAALAAAIERDPYEALALKAKAALDPATTPAQWRRAAQDLPLPAPPS